MKLKDTTLKNAKPREKAYKLFDGGGLYLEVFPNGAKYWRLKFRFGGKENRLALGVYPEISLAAARDKRAETRELLRKGINPAINRKMMKSASTNAAANSFEVVAREWLAKFSPNWEDSHTNNINGRLERDVFPWFQGRAIHEITAPELLACLRRVEKRGALESAHRILQNMGAIFRYAIVTGRAERDTSAALRGALPPAKQKHHPTITDPKAIGILLRLIDTYEGSFVTKCALKLAPLVFVRPGELRQGEWKELDIDKAEWRIPAARMKMRQIHIVPLSKQAIAVLEELKPLTGGGKYMFPGERSTKRPMSNSTVNAALRRLDYKKEEMTGHGFRSMASTILNENGWNRDAIERQLAHGDRDKVRGAYNYAEFLPERQKMMQWWADHLDALVEESAKEKN